MDLDDLAMINRTNMITEHDYTFKISDLQAIAHFTFLLIPEEPRSNLTWGNCLLLELSGYHFGKPVKSRIANLVYFVKNSTKSTHLSSPQGKQMLTMT